MKTVKRDLKNGKLVFRLEVADDLWYLDQVIAVGDIVSSKTQRRVDSGSDKERAERADKKTVTLGVEVESVEFDKNVDRLRATGTIVSGPDDIPRGDHHTLNLHPGLTVTVQKESWGSAELQKVKDAAKVVHARIILVAIEDGTAAIGLLRNYGVQVLGTITQGIAGKDEIKERESETKQFFTALAAALEKEEGVDRFVVAGPGFMKDSFRNYLEDKKSAVLGKIVIESISTGGEKGLQEIVKRGILEKVVKESKLGEEMKYVQLLVEEISKQGLGTYGLVQVENAANLGAIEVLLVANSLVKKLRLEKDMRVENIIKTVEQTKGNVVFVSGEHELGEQLEGLGGIGAVLRYKIE